MNNIFREHLGKFVLVYMDDILVSSKNESEHIAHLKVLQKLRETQFYAKASKCAFFQKELEYLGHIVGQDGIRADPRKLGKVPEWPAPTNLHELRSFLGFANYFRKYIKGYSALVNPLTELMKRTVPFVWGEEQQRTFAAVKTALTTTDVLRIPDPDKSYTVVTDASIKGLGAVLLQDDQPIAFESRKLNPAEQNYGTGEQELLGVVHALKVWRCYLEGCKGITVITDHKPNTFQNRELILSRRQARWMEFLQRFGTINWVYKPGATNCADPLSRIPTQLVLLRASRAGLDEEQRSGVSGAHETFKRASDLALLALNRRPRSGISSPTSADSELMRKIKEGYAGDPLFHGLQGPVDVVESAEQGTMNKHN
jgi:hypothetical protein